MIRTYNVTRIILKKVKKEKEEEEEVNKSMGRLINDSHLYYHKLMFLVLKLEIGKILYIFFFRFVKNGLQIFLIFPS